MLKMKHELFFDWEVPMVAPICPPAEAKTWFDYFVALVPVSTTVMTALIAAYVALISRRQAKTADRKLSLDLYDRRFQIYMRAVDFYQALLVWRVEGNASGVHDKFIRAKLESTFLFPAYRGVRALLDEMGQKGLQIISFEDQAESLSFADKATYRDLLKENQERLEWFSGALERLEKAMVKSMRFHERMDPS